MFEIPLFLEVLSFLIRHLGPEMWFPPPATASFIVADLMGRYGKEWCEYMAQHPELLEKFLEVADYY